jgi:hypothetical protein
MPLKKVVAARLPAATTVTIAKGFCVSGAVRVKLPYSLFAHGYNGRERGGNGDDNRDNQAYGKFPETVSNQIPRVRYHAVYGKLHTEPAQGQPDGASRYGVQGDLKQHYEGCHCGRSPRRLKDNHFAGALPGDNHVRSQKYHSHRSHYKNKPDGKQQGIAENYLFNIRIIVAL